MNRISFIFMALFLQCVGLCSANEILLPFLLENGKGAYLEPSSGKVIGEGFDWRYAFSNDGLARVRNGKLYGFIDRTGKFVIEPTYEDATDFINGSAIVVSNGKYGLIGTNGKLLTAIEYDGLSAFVEDAAFFQKGAEAGYIDRSGKVLFTFEKGDASEPGFAFQDGLAPVRDTKTKKFGYVDKSGKFVISPRFRSAASFAEERAFVSFEDGTEGFIDQTGKTLFKIPAGMTLGGEFHEGLVCVLQSGGPYDQAGFIDATGKLVIPCQFNDISHFSCGLAQVRVFADASKEKELYGYIDHSGKFVIKPVFTMASDFIKDHAIVSMPEDDSLGLIDTKGNFVLKPEFAAIERTFGDYLILRKKGQERGSPFAYADPAGRILSIPKIPGHP